METYAEIAEHHVLNATHGICSCGEQYADGPRNAEWRHNLHIDALRYQWSIEHGFIPTSTDEVSVFCIRCGTAVNLPDRHIQFHMVFEAMIRAFNSVGG